jgi:glycosyltransferase involved in cell wall biosynthesis
MLNACTIIARNYYAYAGVLADSFFAHHPDGTFAVLIIDDEGREFEPDEPRIEWLRLSDLGIERAEIHRLAGIYDVTELATAVKPRLLLRLLEAGRDSIVYLDPDILICHSLAEVGSLAGQHDIVLTPHTLQPFPRDGRRVDGFFVLAAGVYNLGFLAVGQNARAFLGWWWQSTRREALNDVARMMFTDQRWVDFVPSFFEHHILKDPTYNVAYWNLHARDLTWDGDRYLIDGAPMRFFHFSGFDDTKPWLLSRHQGDRPRILLSERPALERLCREYAAALTEAGIEQHRRELYGWSTSASGVPLSTRIRRLYWEAVTSSEAGQGPEPPDPFDAEKPSSFIDWLNSPQPGGPRHVSRFLYSIYRERLDLRSHFPDLDGTDRDRYPNWILGDGVKQAEIPHELLPSRSRTRAAVSAATSADDLTAGVNVAGYFRAELGIGEAARLLVSALEAHDVPCSTMTYGATVSRQGHPFQDRPSNGSKYDVNVVCVNADCTLQFAHDIGPAFFAGRHTAGYWFWELEQFPAAMHRAFDVVDEVWAATDFIAGAVRAAGRKPVFTVPLPVMVPHASPTITRERLSLPSRFTFLQLFDFSSIMERKNPHGLIEAFTRAFCRGEGPILVLKGINGELRLNDRERLRAAAGNRSDIVIIDAYFSPEEKNALLRFCDCYVSLHRAEGMGLTIAEAMALGKPVIATGYSGNLHFMTPENSYLVNYVMSSVPPGCDPYPETAIWAEPDLDEAARFMREVYEGSADSKTRAQRGQADVLQCHSVRTSGAAIAARLERIRTQRRARITVPSTPAPEVSTPAASAALSALEAKLPDLEQFVSPRLSVDGRAFQTFRRAAQRALFRVLRPYWFQQGRFHTELLGTVHRVAQATHQGEKSIQTLDQKVRELTSALHSARTDVRTVEDRLAASTLEQVKLEDRQGRNELRVKGNEHGISRLSTAAKTMQEKARRLEAVMALLDTKAAQVEGRLTSLQGASETFQTNAAAHLGELTRAIQTVEASNSATATFQRNAAAHLGELTSAIQHVEASLSMLSARLFAAPYMARPERFCETDASGRPRLGYRAANGGSGTPFYLGFQEIFRGPEDFIRDRQRVYLPLLETRSDLVDIGCGRGEMLDLLREVGVSASGVDADPDMVRRCRTKGHCVDQMDALAFLRGRPTGSIDTIFTAQVIEHFPFEVLKEFLALCRSRLRRGGLLVAETVNPHALEAFKTFHTDLTHQRPIFPEVALALCQLSGFEQAHILFPLGSGDLDSDRRSQGEYAVVATAGATG